MENEKIKAWVTKYLFSEGILEVEGVVVHKIDSKMLSYGRYTSAHGKDWHRTPEAAIARAEEMRKAKIASLKKSIAKIEAMEFKVKSAGQ